MTEGQLQCTWLAGIDRNTTLLTRFYVTNNVSVAVHPSYNAPTNERDIAVMHIDPLPLEGPSLDFTIAPIGGYAKGAPVHPLLYLRLCATY